VAFASNCRNDEDLMFNLNILAVGAQWVVTSVSIDT